MTTVVNFWHIEREHPDWRRDPQFVYIGRANRRHRLQASIWANPHRMRPAPVLNHLPPKLARFIEDDWNERERTRVIHAFASHLATHEALIRRLPTLDDKTLVCYCKPKACHGDILANWRTWISTLSRTSAAAEDIRQRLYGDRPRWNAAWTHDNEFSETS